MDCKNWGECAWGRVPEVRGEAEEGKLFTSCRGHVEVLRSAGTQRRSVGGAGGLYFTDKIWENFFLNKRPFFSIGKLKMSFFKIWSEGDS